MKFTIRLVTLFTATTCMALNAMAGPSPVPFFSTGNVDGRMAMASRPGTGGNTEIEAADDFTISTETSVNHATFTGLLPTGFSLANVNSVDVEIYRVFPKDSDTARTPNV